MTATSFIFTFLVIHCVICFSTTYEDNIYNSNTRSEDSFEHNQYLKKYPILLLHHEEKYTDMKDLRTTRRSDEDKDNYVYVYPYYYYYPYYYPYYYGYYPYYYVYG